MRAYLSCILCGLFICSTGQAVELQPQPVRTLMSQGLVLAGDEFDDSADSAKGKISAPASGFDLDKPRPIEGRKVSAMRAGLYSALLPGLGEHYVGHKTKAKFFFAVEAAGWIGLVSYRLYGGWRKDDMIDYAAIHAAADLSDKDDDFIDLVGFYTDIDEYNTAGRVGDRERPYLPDTEEYHWRWQSQQEQETFRNLKNRSREAYRRSEFMVGLLVLNRVVSIIDAVRDAKRAQRTIDRGFSNGGKEPPLQLAVDPFDQRNQIKLSWYPGF